MGRSHSAKRVLPNTHKVSKNLMALYTLLLVTLAAAATNAFPSAELGVSQDDFMAEMPLPDEITMDELTTTGLSQPKVAKIKPPGFVLQMPTSDNEKCATEAYCPSGGKRSGKPGTGFDLNNKAIGKSAHDILQEENK